MTVSLLSVCPYCQYIIFYRRLYHGFTLTQKNVHVDPSFPFWVQRLSSWLSYFNKHWGSLKPSSLADFLLDWISLFSFYSLFYLCMNCTWRLHSVFWQPLNTWLWKQPHYYEKLKHNFSWKSLRLCNLFAVKSTPFISFSKVLIPVFICLLIYFLLIKHLFPDMGQSTSVYLTLFVSHHIVSSL